MNKKRAMILVPALSLLLVSMAVSAAPPGTLEELAARPELWPAEVTVKRDAELHNGASVQAGQLVRVQEVRTTDVILDNGSNYFPLLADETDLMERLAAMMESMTPEQIELTPAAVQEQTGLWPLDVTSRIDLSLGDDLDLPAGTEFALQGFNPDGSVILSARASGTVVAMELLHTDLMTRARERLNLPSEKRSPFFIRSLESMLEPPADGSTLADSDYVVLYEGRDSCPRSSAFAPVLAALYNRTFGEDIDFEVVHLAAIDSRAEHKAHLEKTGLAARISKEGRQQDIISLTGMRGEILPYVYLVDQEGNVIAQTSADGEATSPGDVLEKLTEKLAE
jgi:hypothetical protein